jgi:ABC-type lipoprotein export system ATPase subunit
MNREDRERNQQNAQADTAAHDIILRVKDLSKSYSVPGGTLGVLRQVNMEVRRGESVAITGPSGLGKTTLLMLLGALDTPDTGEIWLGDLAVHRLRGPAAADFRREKVGFVFQLFYLLPNLTALENVMVPLLPYRRKLDFDLKKRAVALLEQVGLGDRLDHPPARLSGGEQQRVAIARALLHHPPLLLADEPTGNLDPTTGDEILKVLRQLQRSGDQTLIIVTHDPQIASAADRHIRLEQLSAAQKEES